MEVIKIVTLTNTLPILADINFAELCARIRNHLGLNQEAMAKYLGVSPRAYKYWEAGEREPNAQAAFKLAQLRQELENSRSIVTNNGFQELVEMVKDIHSKIAGINKEAPKGVAEDLNQTNQKEACQTMAESNQ